jgi:hypothetical protein
MTASALARRARLDDDAERAALARVARTAEEVRYAGRKPADEDMEGAVTAARELLGQIAGRSPR